MPYTPRYSPPRDATSLTPEERDARTVFVMQLNPRSRPRDLEEFFSSVGRVRDIRIITDTKTRRSKGIAYVEFWDTESVPLALGLNGQKFMNAPLIIQPTQAEKNRAMVGLVGGPTGLITSTAQTQGPLKLYVGSLHINITEEMLKGIFEPFGNIEQIQLVKEEGTNRSKGYGYVVFSNYEDGKRAMEQLNGFELAGRPMKIGYFTETQPVPMNRPMLDDDSEKPGVDLGTAGRLQLMAKLAEGTGLAMPHAAQQVLTNQQLQQQQQHETPVIATQCFMLTNMFDPTQETENNWDRDIRDDVIDECNKHGGILHIYVDKESQMGNVYVKCPTVASAVAAVNSLHGRWFAGKVITANYVPVQNYHQLFPDSMKTVAPLKPSYQSNPVLRGAAHEIY